MTKYYITFSLIIGYVVGVYRQAIWDICLDWALRLWDVCLDMFLRLLVRFKFADYHNGMPDIENDAE